MRVAPHIGTAVRLPSSPNVKSGRPMALTQVPGSCNGRNVSPALAWSGEPASTQSFALTMVDTDARNGRGPVAFERVQYPASVMAWRPAPAARA